MQECFLCKSAKERRGETAVPELWDLLEKMEWVCSQIIHNKWSFEPMVFGGFLWHQKATGQLQIVQFHQLGIIWMLRQELNCQIKTKLAPLSWN